MKGLTQAGINSDLNERQNMALYYFKAAGKYDIAVREWKAKPPIDKTWASIKTFISVGKTSKTNIPQNISMQMQCRSQQKPPKSSLQC
jgi:hypothetical protein